MTYNTSDAQALIAEVWAEEILGQLSDYIKIPALSPAFDPDWADNGHIQAAVDQIVGWIQSRPIQGMSVRIQTLAGRTPLIVVDIDAFGQPAASASTVLLYGHLDKQPEMIGWREDLGPWTPVLEGDRLYGRGGADDGYAAFASLTAIEAVQASGGSHARCLLVVEASEESGSDDLPAHIDELGDQLGDVSLVVCLDSGCANFDTMWLTTSLRGMVAGTLTVDIVDEGLHSGGASGIVPSTFRILRQLLERIEDSATGDVLIEGTSVTIPDYRVAEVAAVAQELGSTAFSTIPFVDDAEPVTTDIAELLLNRTWRSALSVTGADGLPNTTAAGNVLRPSTSLKLSLRLPPTADHQRVLDTLSAVLLADAPYRSRVRFHTTESAPGWNAPSLEPWLLEALNAASQASFAQPVQLFGEGGSIPFMGMLGEKFPEAQFVVTGVLGPESNAHGPNEFIHIAFAEKLTNCIATLINEHSNQ